MMFTQEYLDKVRKEAIAQGVLTSMECEEVNGRHGDISVEVDGHWYCDRCGR